MATPIKPNDTQEGCNPISSNCVLWQGPDIPCINLCKGDTISDVTAKLASELCTLVDQLAIENFDVSCFPPICPKPENIQDLIQFILDTLCGIEQGTVPIKSNGTGATNCTESLNCPITIAKCFQYTDAFGNLVTEMSIKDYATAIANKVCTLTNNIVTINASIGSIENRLNTLEACVLPCRAPVFDVTVPTSCLSPSTDIPLVDFVEDLEAAFCALQAATGTPTEIATAVAEECINLDTTATLNNSSVTYNALPGWVSAGSYSNASHAINNIWLVLCDMRKAVESVVTNCCNPSCDDVNILMTASYTNPTLSLLFTGTAPGFADCSPGGMFVTITDAYGVNYTTQVAVIASLGGPAVTINLTTSGLNLYTDYTVRLNVCADDGTLKCNDVLIETVTNSALCPSMSYAPDTTYIDFGFTNNIASPVTYIIECWNSALTGVITTQTIVNPAVGAQSGSLTGLTTATNYQIRVRVVIGSTIRDCSYTSVTTT
jgi:hypothetical protein